MKQYQEPSNTGILIMTCIATASMAGVAANMNDYLNSFYGESSLNLAISVFSGLLTASLSVWAIRRSAELLRTKR